MAQLRQQQSELDQRNVDVKVVTFDSDFLAKAYVKETNLPWPLLLDADREYYRAYGFIRVGWWTLLNPVAIFGYIKLIFRGFRPGHPGRDWKQLGGDVIIDPAGMIRLHHVSTDPHDRPSVATILSLIDRD